MESWNIITSSNQTQSHQFRIQTLFALFGFGAVIGTIFINIDSILLGASFLVITGMMSSILDRYYFKVENSWLRASNKIQETSCKISLLGYREYIKNGGEINTPQTLFGRFYKDKEPKWHNIDLFSGLVLILFVSVTCFSGFLIEIDRHKTSIEQEELDSRKELDLSRAVM